MFEIYLITNNINGKVYVGQAIRGKEKRWNRHLNDMKAGSELYLHRAIRKYGAENFTVSLLATAESHEELNRLEVLWVFLLKSHGPGGYNMTDGGEGCTGALQSEETKAKKSKALMGKNIGKNAGEKGWRFRHDLDTAHLVELYRSGKSCEQIGRLLGFSVETVVSRLHASGVKLRSNSEAQKIRCSVPENTPVYRSDVSTNDMVDLFQKGMTNQAVADVLGVSKACVRRRLAKLGVSRPPHRCALDKDRVAELYQSGATAYDLADQFDVSPGSVYRALEEQGIPIRSKSSQPKKAFRTEKVCPGCKTLLSLSSYNKDKTTIDGHMSVCRECVKLRRKGKAPLSGDNEALFPTVGLSAVAVESC